MSRPAGFTLLELLVATTVLALILVLLGGGVSFGGRAWRAHRGQADALVATAAAEDALRQLIATARPLSRFAPGSDVPLPGLEGDASAVTLVGELPAAFGLPGLYDITLKDRPDGSLVLAWTPHRLTAVAVASGKADSATVIAGVEAMELAYLAAATPERTAAWAESWREQRTLPLLLRIRLRFRPDTGPPRHWPDLVVSPGGRGLIG